MSAFDIEDFLRQVLDDIWNRKLAGRLYDCAAATMAVHGPSGQELYGQEEAIGDVLRWLAAFPDTRMQIDELIWEGDERRGFLASALQTYTATNQGASIYGPATGRPARGSWIAHYLIHDGLIREVWQETDELALIWQLGLEPAVALTHLNSWRPLREVAEPFAVGEVRRPQQRQRTPETQRASPALAAVQDLVLGGLHDIWNRRLVGGIEDVYHPELRWLLGDQEPGSRQDLAAHVLSRLTAFPDLALVIDQIICQGDEAGGYLTSVAWTLLGTHAGPGVYGPPTLRRIRMRGLTRQRIEGGQIVQERVQSGELDLLQQLLAPVGAGTAQTFTV